MAKRSNTIGQTGLIRFNGVVDEEWHPKLRGTQGVKIYREMSDNDAVIGAILFAITSLAQQVRWGSVPADQSRRSKKEAEFLDSVIGDMSHTWDDFISEVLTMLPFGWSYFEKVMKDRIGSDSRYQDGRTGIKKISIRAQETLDSWEFDEDGGIRGMWQVAPPSYQRVFLPIEKCVLFRTRINKNSPEGRSLLRNSFRSWYFLKKLQEIEGIGIERDLCGLPVFEVPLSYTSADALPENREKFLEYASYIQSIRRNEHDGLVIPSEVNESTGQPSGFRFRLMSSGGQRSLDIHAAIVRYEQRISMTLLAQFIMMGMDKVGSFSLASSITDLFAVAIGAMLDNIEATFNRFVVEDVMKLNGIPEKNWPTWKHGDIERQKISELGTFIMNLVNVGALTPDDTLEDYLRNQASLPKRDEETARERGRAGAGVDIAPVQPDAPSSEIADVTQNPDAESTDLIQ